MAVSLSSPEIRGPFFQLNSALGIVITRLSQLRTRATRTHARPRNTDGPCIFAQTRFQPLYVRGFVRARACVRVHTTKLHATITRRFALVRTPDRMRALLVRVTVTRAPAGFLRGHTSAIM